MSRQSQDKDITPVFPSAANGNMIGQRTNTFEVRRAVWAGKQEAEALGKQEIVSQSKCHTRDE